MTIDKRIDEFDVMEKLHHGTEEEAAKIAIDYLAQQTSQGLGVEDSIAGPIITMTPTDLDEALDKVSADENLMVALEAYVKKDYGGDRYEVPGFPDMQRLNSLKKLVKGLAEDPEAAYRKAGMIFMTDGRYEAPGAWEFNPMPGEDMDYSGVKVVKVNGKDKRKIEVSTLPVEDLSKPTESVHEHGKVVWTTGQGRMDDAKESVALYKTG